MAEAAGVSVRNKKMGPDGYSKIAIVGSAPTSVRLAPYNDLSWSIWCCSPGVFGQAPRHDVWWELHRWEPPVIGEPMNANNKTWFSPEYVEFLKNHPGPVMMAGPDWQNDHPVPSVKNGWRFPFEDYVAKYGRYFFASSMSWMIAHAIELLAPRAQAGEKVAIGLWGVDMSASEEYAYQRPGCQHFLGLAVSAGIEIILPPESDLLQPPSLYGICEYGPRHTKLLANLQNLQNREMMLASQVGNANNELIAVRGSIAHAKWVLATWADDLEPNTTITSAVSLAGVSAGRMLPSEAVHEHFDQSPAFTEALDDLKIHGGQAGGDMVESSTSAMSDEAIRRHCANAMKPPSKRKKAKPKRSK